MEDRDTRPVTIERSDAIDAAGALIQLARSTRKQAKQRHNSGPAYKQHRAWLRDTANGYDEAAKRVQQAADNAF